MPRYTFRNRMTGSCQVCIHPERGRIDYLIASGATKNSLAKKFNLSKDAMQRHGKKHISAEYRATIRVGPFGSEGELRKLVAENSASVVQNLASIYGALASRFLACFEAGADQALVSLTKEMHRNLQLRATISKELAPNPSMVVNILQTAPVLELQSRLLKVLAAHPQARADVVAMFRQFERQPLQLIEVAAEAGEQAA